MTSTTPTSVDKIPDRSQPRAIALIAHDNKKQDLVEWARFNLATLKRHHLMATGTTGGLLEQELGLKIEKLKSGPLGGDQQIGASIVEGRVDLVKALLRIAVVYDVPMACNRSTADFMISSPLMVEPGFTAEP
jgi:methylglyoxal synthase